MAFFSLAHDAIPSVPDTALSQERILLVDDDNLHRTCLKESLEFQGYVCLEAVNGMKGLEALRDESVSIIITDNNMPEMDGLTFIEQVNQTYPHELVPIFLMTAELSDSVRFRAFKHGVNRVFEKPLDFRELCQALDWVIKFDLHAPSR
jgi:two-component system chemotaxis response regulator CheY